MGERQVDQRDRLAPEEHLPEWIVLAGISFREVVVSDVAEQMQLMQRCDARSFPVVFLDDVFLGGFTHVVHPHSQGRLQELAGADLEWHAPPATPATGAARTAVSDALDTVRGFAAWGEYKARRR